MNNLKNILFSGACNYVIDFCRFFLPKQFIVSYHQINKHSFFFKVFTILIVIHVGVLSYVRKQNKEFLSTFQNRRLRRIIKMANKTVWWRNYFRVSEVNSNEIKKVSDLSVIPPVKRTFLTNEAQRNLLTRDFYEKEDQINITSGSTTGTPFSIAFEKSVLTLDVTAHYINVLENYGFSFTDNLDQNFLVHFNLFSGSTRLITLRGLEQFAIRTVINKNDSLNLEKRIREINKIIHEVNQCVFFTHPSELPFFIQKLKEYNLHPPIRWCLVIGQILEPNVRIFAEEYLKCPVISVYGLREKMLVGSACMEHRDLFHPHSERAIIEIVDENGVPVENDIYGNITITGLDNLLMPLIRYQPGDVGRFRRDLTCSCKNQSFLFEIYSRETDVFRFSNGTKKPAQKFLKTFTLFVTQIRRFQVVQEAINKVIVNLELRDKNDFGQIVQKVEQRIRKDGYLPNDIELEIKIFDWIDEGKGKFKVFVPLKND